MPWPASTSWPEPSATRRAQPTTRQAEPASKLTALIAELKAIGVGPKSDDQGRRLLRADRHPRLAGRTPSPPRLKLKDKHVRVLHGGMADVKQMDVIEEFGLADADGPAPVHRRHGLGGCEPAPPVPPPHPLRSAVVADHHRAAQRPHRPLRPASTSPEIRALLLKPNRPDLDGDVRVLTKLLEREHQAHRAFGDSGSLLGLHDVEAEEEAITDAGWSEGGRPRRRHPDRARGRRLRPPGTAGRWHRARPGPQLSTRRRCSTPRSEFVDEALAAAFDDPDHACSTVAVRPTTPSCCRSPHADDLMPPSGRPAPHLPGRAEDRRAVPAHRRSGQAAEARLERARNDTDSSWPEVGHLSPLHPLVDWLADKVLVAVGRNEAPVIVADVDRPVFCVQGLYSNGRGQPQLVEWMAVTEAVSGRTVIDDLFDVLAKAGVGPDDGQPGPPDRSRAAGRPSCRRWWPRPGPSWSAAGPPTTPSSTRLLAEPTERARPTGSQQSTPAGASARRAPTP